MCKWAFFVESMKTDRVHVTVHFTNFSYSHPLKTFKCRLGSARAVNRRYISDCVPSKIRIKASAAFVSASALGMACGPALAGLLQWNFKLSFLTFSGNTLPGWVMAFAWLVYLAWLWIAFKEPFFSAETMPAQDSSSGHQTAADQLESGLAQPLLLNEENKEISEEGEDGDDSEDATSEDSHKPANSFRSAYRLLTPSVKANIARF